ncbi:type 2 isopentenyl-diphosphate Delta-isomerase [Candidatus Dependentiae bacterium]
MSNNEIEKRKDEHLSICLDKNVQSCLSNGFDEYRLQYNALPEIDFDSLDLSVEFFGKKLSSPFLLSAMTGGTQKGKEINQRLATVAQKMNVAMCVGSQRAMLKDPSLSDTFAIRDKAPDILLFANFGAIQLNNGYAVEHCQHLVDAIGADALVLHLNPLHEAVQPEGDTNFQGLSNNIKTVVDALSVPVIIKEVGCGISGDVAQRLASLGVGIIDVAGAGGTSFPTVEGYRAGLKDPKIFGQLGIPTAESIVQVKGALDTISVIASGGITNGIDAAKALALGADLVGFAGVLLGPAMHSDDLVQKTLERIATELKVAMFSAGASQITSLRGRVFPSILP